LSAFLSSPSSTGSSPFAASGAIHLERRRKRSVEAAHRRLLPGLGVGGRGRHRVVDHPEHRRVLLRPRDRGRRLLVVLVGQAAEVRCALLLRPALERRHRDAVAASLLLAEQRREHPRDVADERVVEDDDEHPVGPEALGILEREVREPVEADRRLAAARAALDDDEARVGPRDELELARIDEGGDLRQVPVLAPLDPRAELAARLPQRRRAVVAFGPHRRALAAREARRGLAGALPLTVDAAHEDALRRADAAQEARADRERAPREHLAVHVAAAEVLLVDVALFVAVVDAAHRRVAPVDDAHPGARIEVRALSDQHLAAPLALLEHEPPEVRRLGIDGALGHLRAARGDLAQALHLLDERRHVLEARLLDLIAEREQLGVVVDPVVRDAHPARREVLLDAREDALLLGDDLRLLVVALLATVLDRFRCHFGSL
jgi:hypothetical protein